MDGLHQEVQELKFEAEKKDHLVESLEAQVEDLKVSDVFFFQSLPETVSKSSEQ